MEFINLNLRICFSSFFFGFTATGLSTGTSELFAAAFPASGSAAGVGSYS